MLSHAVMHIVILEMCLALATNKDMTKLFFCPGCVTKFSSSILILWFVEVQHVHLSRKA